MIERKRQLRNLGRLLRRSPVVALLGARQVGKTTLLRTLAGLQPADDGEVIDSFTITAVPDTAAPTARLTSPADNGPFDLNIAAGEILLFVDADVLRRLGRIFRRHKGRCPTQIRIEVPGLGTAVVVPEEHWNVTPDEGFVDELERLVGPGGVVLS